MDQAPTPADPPRPAGRHQPRGGSDRDAVRVVCYDLAGRVLLMRWNLTGAPYWEPPGGGVEADESWLAAARREFHEETGLSGDLVADHSIAVRRDFAWFGQPCLRVERFFRAEVPAIAPVVSPAALTARESTWLQGQGWFSLAEIHECTEHVEPPDLLQRLAEFHETPHRGTGASC